MSIPYRLLEVHILSANDLPPMSKMLRTFVVAWVSSDNKLSTRVDHHGHTNPAWNYKLVFRVDDNFMQSEASAVNLEIFNVAWLRDLPIGTARLMINQMSPPLQPRSQTMRTVALHIRRTSGHLQGILNVGLILHGDLFPVMPPQGEFSNDSSPSKKEASPDRMRSYNMNRGEEESHQQIHSRNSPQRSRSSTPLPTHAGISPLADSSVWSKLESDEKSRAVSSNTSLCSAIRPLPSEVALDMMDGYYVPQGNEIGSTIFDNWSEPSGGSLRSRSERWVADDRTNLLDKDSDGKQKQHRSHQRRHSSSSGEGLFSCFGNAYGFQFKIFCGSNSDKRSRKSKSDHM